MAIIFPGNYVERLNAYSSAKTDEDGNVTSAAANRQGVEALPGLTFFSAVGVLEVPPAGIAQAVSKMKVLSPDMRSDDKPRLDTDMVIPNTAEVYSVAIRAINLKDAAASKTIAAAVASDGSAFQTNLASATLSSVATTFEYAGSARTVFTGFKDTETQTMGADTIIYCKHDVSSSNLLPINTDDVAAVIIEICYFMYAEPADEDDVNLPYKTEAGSS